VKIFAIELRIATFMLLKVKVNVL